MLRQTARNLYNWKGDSPPQALLDAREDAANDYAAYNNNDDAGTDTNSDWWAQYWDNDEDAALESEVATDEQPTSNDLIMAFTILAIGLTCVVLMAVGLYVCCERRRTRQQFEQQAEQAETELNEAQSLARAKKIAQKLRLVEVSCKDGVLCAKTGKNNPNKNTGKGNSDEMTVTTNKTGDSASSSSTTSCSHKHKKSHQDEEEGKPTSDTASLCSSSSASTKDDEDAETASAGADVDVEQPIVDDDNSTAETKPSQPAEDTSTTTTTCGIEIEEGADEDDHCCSICLNPYNAHEWISASNNAKCKHMYHKECIEEWLMKQDGCPVCRRPYLEEEGAERDFVA